MQEMTAQVGPIKGWSSEFKAGVIALAKNVVVGSPLPIAAQKWLIDHLPLDGLWPKSLAYQQCLANRVLKQYGNVVQAGLFKGMPYLDDADEGCIIPKLLGCYEEELEPTFEKLLKNGYDRVLDVGHASGYFVVGFARSLPNSQVFGFDVDPGAIARCKQLIALNGVGSRVTLGGFLRPPDLQSLISGRTLILMDCEGGEYDLLDPVAVPALLGCDIVVEIHDFINPEISSTLERRFKDTHHLEKIGTQERQPTLEKYPGLKSLPKAYWDAATHERRPCPMEWFVLRPKHVNVP